MTVRELIKELEEMPQNAPVVFCVPSSGEWIDVGVAREPMEKDGSVILEE